MALAQDIHHANARTGGIGARILAFFTAIGEARARRKVYALTVRELRGLSNRELADMGVNRSMITRVALEAAYGK
ncbi:DUF1127 domain-containing protein [Pontitalea aquivivens]|uniref:DUF1127 domain-containing protein n=1 Tax=Pontitalea aquivivens TaxID=3388663 RepID=UPI003970E75D